MLTDGTCPASALFIKDALESVEGKWKLLILFSLSKSPKRFTQIAREVNGITDKTLSHELKTLEANKLLSRTVIDSFPPTVEYALTEHGRSLEKVLETLQLWGVAHRKEVIGK